MSHSLSDAAVLAALIGFFATLITFAVRRHFADSSVNNAVFAEMGRVLEAVQSHEHFWRKCVQDGTTRLHPLIPFAHLVYDAQINNVGVVDRKRVEDVVRFFGYVDYINRFQALQRRYQRCGIEGEFNAMYLEILSRLTARHTRPAK